MKRLGNTAQKMKFYITNFFSKCDQIRISGFPVSADLVTSTEEILNEKLDFLYSANRAEFLKNLGKCSKDHHFTVNGCQIVKFCDTVEHFFEKIALTIKKY